VIRIAIRLRRGVSLIEAICALGVMAFGMLAVVGVQATLRSNADVSKQRSEATRLAQQGMERSRGFGQLAGIAANAFVEYDEIISVIELPVPGINASYIPTRNVAAPRYPRLKTVTSSVSWIDRAGVTQTVQLNSAIAGISPEVAASMALPQQSGVMLQAVGRSSSVPLLAKDLSGTGTSVFVPPQAAAGTVAWVFNNFSGLITGVCNLAAGVTTATVLAADVAACSNNTTAQLVSGYVRFASTAAQPTPAEAESPSASTLNLDMVLELTSVGHPGPGATCFDDSSGDVAVAATRQVVTYFCAVFSNLNFTWAGRTRIAPRAMNAGVPWLIAAAVGPPPLPAVAYKICRYSPLAVDVGSKNSDHPLDYTVAGSKAKAALVNQNFLVISAAHVCPTDIANAGDFVNSNTLLHQDGSVAYNNPP
jgi:Tfp pilus assembly protein PilV